MAANEFLQQSQSMGQDEPAITRRMAARLMKAMADIAQRPEQARLHSQRGVRTAARGDREALDRGRRSAFFSQRERRKVALFTCAVEIRRTENRIVAVPIAPYSGSFEQPPPVAL